MGLEGSKSGIGPRRCDGAGARDLDIEAAVGWSSVEERLDWEVEDFLASSAAGVPSMGTEAAGSTYSPSLVTESGLSLEAVRLCRKNPKRPVVCEPRTLRSMLELANVEPLTGLFVDFRSEEKYRVRGAEAVVLARLEPRSSGSSCGAATGRPLTVVDRDAPVSSLRLPAAEPCDPPCTVSVLERSDFIRENSRW